MSRSTSAQRQLSVVFLVDASGSMAEHGKLSALNLAMREMLDALATMSAAEGEVRCAVIGFNGARAYIQMPLAGPLATAWTEIRPGGGTPFGAALELLIELVAAASIDDGASQTVIILVSDGQPTDEYERALRHLDSSASGSQSVRLAMSIGPDCDTLQLERFAGDRRRVFAAVDACEIDRLLKFVLAGALTELGAK